ncbi:bifunctional 3-phenylpropionate/cinnamic acid dioxygenase ferredoxin subunit [Streptomyces griseorubiginosus]|uniref:bifunctional 3-phenylpropionate/cinnamic acid dioxygenase ferredoxin subunit n=1 Tax=Streptomyces griseorubiginosus TaxID=67304 RepID=UPI0027E2F81E|nr:bifunctional 3-phenylpropionate/cinnamic acid dioxygenase ferredoxin subunit [Streptomyces griseorubiginosus]
MKTLEDGIPHGSRESRPLDENRLVYVSETHEIADGESRRVDSPLLPESVAVFNSDGNFYALGDTCSHGAASLAEGWVENCRVVCPLHFSEFELGTGRPRTLPAMAAVRTYTVEVRGESVYVAGDDYAPQTRSERPEM